MTKVCKYDLRLYYIIFIEISFLYTSIDNVYSDLECFGVYQ